MQPFIPQPEPKPVSLGNPDPLVFPNTTGREVGAEWWEDLPGGGKKKFTIPEGNGTNTVDIVVFDAEGKIVTNARVASVEGGPGYVRWQDDSSGESSYFDTLDPSQGGFGLRFAPGMSTLGPGREFEVGPNWEWVKTPSYDADGNFLGYDVGIRNKEGLYDNTHIDGYGNKTFTSATRNALGGVNSQFVGQIDSSGRGWILDQFGRPAERFLDGNGQPVVISTDPDTGKRTVNFGRGRNTFDSEGNLLGHLDFGEDGRILNGWEKNAWYSKQRNEYHTDWMGLLREEIVDPITGLRGEVRSLGDRTKVTYSDGTVVLYDKNYNPIDTRSTAEKIGSAAYNFGKGAGKSLWALAASLGALSGINDGINQVGSVLGQNWHWTSRADVGEGLALGIGSLLLADVKAYIGTGWGIYKSATGEQSWGKTWNDAWHSALNVYNETSKLAIGTDWSNFPTNPAETLGTATVGVASWLVPAKVPARLGGKGTTGVAKLPPPKPSPKPILASGAVKPTSPRSTPGLLVDDVPFSHPALDSSKTNGPALQVNSLSARTGSPAVRPPSESVSAPKSVPGAATAVSIPSRVPNGTGGGLPSSVGLSHSVRPADRATAPRPGRPPRSPRPGSRPGDNPSARPAARPGGSPAAKPGGRPPARPGERTRADLIRSEEPTLIGIGVGADQGGLHVVGESRVEITGVKGSNVVNRTPSSSGRSGNPGGGQNGTSATASQNASAGGHSRGSGAGGGHSGPTRTGNGGRRGPTTGASRVVEFGERLPDGSVLEPGTYTKTVKGEATFYSDAAGHPEITIANLDPPAIYEKDGVGNLDEPVGWIDGVDHRGHMAPERGAKNKPDFNVDENVFSQQGNANTSAKKRWENAAIAWAKANSDISMMARVLGRDATGRPTMSQYWLFDENGKEIPGFTVIIENPSTKGVKARTFPQIPKYPKPKL